jgi:hypothetical protein
MSKTAAIYAEALAVIAAVAAATHYLIGLDWPWAIAAGAATSILVRAVIHRRPSRPAGRQSG